MNIRISRSFSRGLWRRNNGIAPPIPIPNSPFFSYIVQPRARSRSINQRTPRMKTSILGLIMTMATLTGLAQQNPLLTDYGTAFETPPFDRITNEQFMPAFMEAMQQESREVDGIVATTGQPTFPNTIEALDRSGILLDRVRNVFFTLQGANTTDEIQQIANDVTPLLTKHRDDIVLNERLFQRVKAVHVQRASLKLTD